MKAMRTMTLKIMINGNSDGVVSHPLCYTVILSREQCGFLSYALGNVIVMLSFLSLKRGLVHCT